MNETKLRERLPRGQVLTKKWPVLTYGETPRADRASWTFRCFGLVQEPVSWTWEEFLQLPRVEVTSAVEPAGQLMGGRGRLGNTPTRWAPPRSCGGHGPR